MAIIVVLNKENLATLQNTQNKQVVLNQSSIVQVGYSKEDITAIVRSGHKVVITLKNGEKIVIENFFAADGTSIHHLVLPNQNAEFDIVEFDTQFKVINYNPLANLTTLATGQTWIQTQPTTVSIAEPIEAQPWLSKPWVKPALIALGIEALYLTAFKKDDNNTDTTPIDFFPPATPTATLAADAKVITGRTEAHAKVYVKDLQGNILGESVADATGSYTLNANREIVNGERVQVYAVDAAGNISTSIAVQGNKDTLPPEAPQAQLNNTGNMISGKSEAGAKISVYAADGITLLAGPITAAADGSFSLVINPPLAANTEAKVIATDAAGNISDSSVVAVGKDTLAPDRAKAEVNETGTLVKGIAEPYATIEIRNTAGQLIATTTVNENGRFEVTLTSALESKQIAHLTVKDVAGNTSKPLEISQKFDNVPPNAITAVINSDGTIVTGVTDEPLNKIEVRDSSGNVLASGIADSSGKFSITLSKPLVNNASANVYSIDAANNMSPAAQVVGSKDTVAPTRPVLSTVTDDIGTQKGTISAGQSTDDTRPKFDGRGEANATLTIYDHGIAITTVKVASNGAWTYTPEIDLSLGEHTFSFTQMDAAGNTSEMSVVFSFTVVAAAVTALAFDASELNDSNSTDIAAFLNDETYDLSVDDVLNGVLNTQIQTPLSFSVLQPLLDNGQTASLISDLFFEEKFFI